ncbi:glycosyltransferase family 2 protein [Glycomyces sp. TRM65418]|uniref:glycosyltransferase family 2 protein n=1 Tax=Glycomyces sp. TRM65418 TaxID=2867006 RepID=UPI001CE6BC4E|nr:glycosyltransferase family 2 protein [Glycomyces sp. TRM65418]MCC3765895.1 glycosyltransferase family 2 protein [Glycomyces sp. TRM65418]QZD55478.1 glycosyltransferase family 2 protein [Glycomyces sp. TRM65418]
MGSPLTVSAIVPCHDAADTIRACIEALANQTRAPDEIIVVDDASTDDSARIAAGYDCRVITSERNRGPSAARNTAIAAAGGDVLFCVDADVALRPDAVANALALLEADDDLDIVHGTYEPEPQTGTGVVERYLVLREAHWRHRFAGPANVVVFAVAAVRREVFDRFGPLDERLRDCEDVEYSARMAGRASIVITETVAGRHDAGSTLLRALRTQWRRAVPLASLRPDPPVRLERINRMRSLAATALALALLPLAVLYPPLLLGSAAAIAFALAADAGLIRYFARHAGRAAAVRLTAVHVCFLAVLVCGIAVGLTAPRRPATTPDRSIDHATH